MFTEEITLRSFHTWLKSLEESIEEHEESWLRSFYLLCFVPNDLSPESIQEKKIWLLQEAAKQYKQESHQLGLSYTSPKSLDQYFMLRKCVREQKGHSAYMVELHIRAKKVGISPLEPPYNQKKIASFEANLRVEEQLLQEVSALLARAKRVALQTPSERALKHDSLQRRALQHRVEQREPFWDRIDTIEYRFEQIGIERFYDTQERLELLEKGVQDIEDSLIMREKIFFSLDALEKRAHHIGWKKEYSMAERHGFDWKDLQKEENVIAMQETRYYELKDYLSWNTAPAWVDHMWSFPIPASKLDELIELMEFDQRWRNILKEWRADLPPGLLETLELPPPPIRPADITRILPAYKAARNSAFLA